MQSELVTGSVNSVVFWEEHSLSKRRSAQPFPDSDYHIASLSWNVSNSKLAVVPKCGDRIAVCNFKEDILTWSYLMHTDGGTFTCGRLLHNGRYLVSGCGNSSILMWDLKHKNVVRSFEGHGGSAVTDVAVSSLDQFVVSASQDGSILLHPLSSSSKQKLVQLTKDQPLGQPIVRLSLSLTDQSHLGTVSEGGGVCLWSVDSQRMLTKFSPPHSGTATDLCFTPSNNMLMVSVGMDARVKCYDLHSRKVIATISAPGPLSSVAILKDGSTLVAGSVDGHIYVYELRSVKTPKTVIEGHQTAVTAIAPQYSSKVANKKNSARKPGVKFKGQLSSEKGMPQSSEKSPPKGQRSAAHIAEDRDSLKPHPLPPSTTAYPSDKRTQIQQTLAFGRVLPETVTPFVTQASVRPGQIASSLPISLEVQTPYSMVKPGLRSEEPDAHLSSLLATPALGVGNISSVFSPLEHHQPETPMPSTFPLARITAAIPPTKRLDSVAVALTTSHSAPPEAAAAALYKQAPMSIVSRFPPMESTPLNHSLEGLGSGIFSPIDCGSNAHHGSYAPSSLQHSSQVGVTAPVTSHVTNESTSSQGYMSHVDHVTIPVSVVQSSCDASETMRVPQQGPDPAPLHGKEVAGDHSSKESTSHMSLSIETQPPSITDGRAIQTQYLERVIHESTEELWYSVHRDTRGLTVDMIKQFLTLQEGLALQFSILNEKVDKLSEENKQLEELLHRYMPKH